MDRRSFPRYNILNLNAYLVFEGSEDKVWVKDLSLGGLQLYHTKSFEVSELHHATFYLGKKFIRKLIVKEVWSRESIARREFDLELNEALEKRLSEINYLSGLSFYFEDLKEFKHWRTLIMAMHNYKISKK